MQTGKEVPCGSGRVSRRGLLLMLAGALATGTASLAAAAAKKQPLECPANWEKGTRACKRARADRKCPELRGGKCLADEQTSSPAPSAPSSASGAAAPPFS